MNIHKRALSLLLSFALVFGIFGMDTTGAFAAQSSDAIQLSIDSGNILITDSGYFASGNSQKQNPSAGGYVISGSTTHNTISVTGGTQYITIQNVGIDVSGTNNACAFSIAAGAKVNLTLEGTNTLKSGQYCAGLQVPGDGNYPPDAAGNAFLTIGAPSDSDSLTTTGGNEGAGIGGGYEGFGGSITINGGKVEAIGGVDCAGIGGGMYRSGGTIAINRGSTVTATCGVRAAGIGGGNLGTGGNITIDGGIVMATGDRVGAGTGYSFGAGIGGGGTAAGGNITIAGGHVTAKGGSGGGAGIGSGASGAGGSVTIRGGIVEAIGGSSPGGQDGGAGIGDGQNGNGGTVTIFGTGTQVTAKGQSGGKDIGSGGSSVTGRTLVGGTLTVGDSSTAEPLPTVTFLAAGTNATNPGTTRPQFMNCVIQGAGANGISGCYDTSGKITLDISMSMPSSVKVGEPVTLTANVKRHYFNDTMTLPGTVQLYVNSVPFGSPVRIAPDGTAQINWTPSNGSEVSLKAKYMPTATDRYAAAESVSLDCTPGKTTPTVSSLPTASAVTVGSPLSASTLSGGTATVPGVFSWVNRNQPVTASKDYPAVFTPYDPTIYNSVFLMVPVNVTAPSSDDHSSNISAPSLPTSVADTPTSTTVDLSGATFPAGVTGVSLAVTPEAANGASAAPGNAGIPADPQGAAVYHLVISQTGLNLIGSPFVYNIKLLDQNGNPITSFTGSVTVKVAIPAGIHGTPHIFRYEDSTGTFTDLSATVQDGYLVFQTSHFSYYVIAGTGDSVTLDTKNYQMPVGGGYQIGVKLTGRKATSVKVYSTNNKIETVARLKNGCILVTGKGVGTAYVMIDVYDNKNHLLTHASVRVDVKTGIRPRGDSTRQIGVF